MRERPDLLDEMDDTPTVIRPLKAPDRFVPSIPEDLLEGLGKRDRNVLNTLSVMGQKQDWDHEQVLHHHECLLMLENRLRRCEKVVRFLGHKWSGFVIVVLWLAPYVVPKFISWVTNGRLTP